MRLRTDPALPYSIEVPDWIVEVFDLVPVLPGVRKSFSCCITTAVVPISRYKCRVQSGLDSEHEPPKAVCVCFPVSEQAVQVPRRLCHHASNSSSLNWKPCRGTAL